MEKYSQRELETMSQYQWKRVCFFFTPLGAEEALKLLYLHLSDDTTQDAAAVKCHIEYALDNLHKKGKGETNNH